MEKRFYSTFLFEETPPEFSTGSAGAPLARRLAEVEDWNVLLIEAGVDPPQQWLLPVLASFPDPGLWAVYEWNYGTQPSNTCCKSFRGKRCNYRRAKVLGGCSSNNFMMYVRGSPLDYNEWEALGNPGWGFEDVLPYFRKSEAFLPYPVTREYSNTTVSARYHSHIGPMSINTYPKDPMTMVLRNGLYDAASSLGHPRNLDINGPQQIGFTDLESSIDASGFRMGTARAFLQKTPGNLFVCKEATVDKLHMIEKRVFGVEVKRRSKTLEFYAKKEVILSAGSIGTPGILERSGIGNREILIKAGINPRHHLPGVGENMQDHFIHAGNIYSIDLHSAGPVNPLSISMISFVAFLNTFGNSSVPDIQFVHFAFPNFPELGVSVMGKSLNWNERLLSQVTKVNGERDVFIPAPILIRPSKLQARFL